MKFTLVCVTFLALFALSKADDDSVASTSPNFEPQFKKLAEVIEQGTKALEEATGMKTDYSKEKFFSLLKTSSSKLSEDMKSFFDKLQKDNKAVPEELRKKYDELVKSLENNAKLLTSPEVQQKYHKLQETYLSTTKKMGEQLTDLCRSFGIALPKSMEKPLNELNEEIMKLSKSLEEKTDKLIENVQEEWKKKSRM